MATAPSPPTVTPLRGVDFHCRSTFFSHVFDGYYDGTHYSYLWSAALEAIALQWLDEEGGLSRANGQRLRDAVLSRGGVVDPIALRSITGREPSVGPCSNGAAWRVNRGDRAGPGPARRSRPAGRPRPDG